MLFFANAWGRPVRATFEEIGGAVLKQAGEFGP